MAGRRGRPARPAPTVISAEGTTLVQFRAVDGAGNVSAWVPAAADATNTVKLDRGAPTNPTVSGATGAWSNAASVVVTASGSTDGGSSVSGYQYQTSFNGGVFSASTSGSSVTVSAQGTTVVQFRALDAAGNTSGWVQGTVKLDRTLPTSPTVSGGSTSWSAAASRTIAAATRPTPCRASPATSTAPRRTRLDLDATAAGASAVITAEGTTIVQFRSVDNAGTLVVAAHDRRFEQHREARPHRAEPADRHRWIAHLHEQPYHDPRVGPTDTMSGFSTYQYRYSTNAGATWSATVRQLKHPLPNPAPTSASSGRSTG